MAGAGRGTRPEAEDAQTAFPFPFPFPMKNARSLWLYCIVRSKRAPSSSALRAKGVPGSLGTRALDAGKGLWMIVGDVDRATWTTEKIESKLHDMDWLSGVALGHESVVERFVGAPALLPSKLFTLFHDDESALAHVEGARSRIGKILDRVSERVEMGVRVSLDEVKALKKAEAEAKKHSKGASGAGFLLRKKRVAEVARAGGAAAQEAASVLHAKLAKKAASALRKEVAATADGGQSRLLLDAAYLVDMKKAPAFRREAKTLAKTASKEGLSLELTGPWPAYHFAGEAS